jgi:hypothetical protein
VWNVGFAEASEFRLKSIHEVEYGCFAFQEVEGDGRYATREGDSLNLSEHSKYWRDNRSHLKAAREEENRYSWATFH